MGESEQSMCFWQTTYLLAHGGHPNAEARRNDENHPGEGRDISMDEPRFRVGENPDNNSTKREKDNPSNRAEGGMGDFDCVIIRGLCTSVLSNNNRH